MGHEKPTPVHSVAIQSFCWGRQILIPFIFFQIKLPLHWAKRAGTHSNRALTTSVSHHTYKYRICNLKCDRRLRRLLWMSVTLKEIVQKSVHILKSHSTELQLKSNAACPCATSHLQIPVHNELTCCLHNQLILSSHHQIPHCTDLIHIMTAHSVSSTRSHFYHMYYHPTTYSQLEWFILRMLSRICRL